MQYEIFAEFLDSVLASSSSIFIEYDKSKYKLKHSNHGIVSFTILCEHIVAPRINRQFWYSRISNEIGYEAAVLANGVSMDSKSQFVEISSAWLDKACSDRSGIHLTHMSALYYLLKAIYEKNNVVELQIGTLVYTSVDILLGYTMRYILNKKYSYMGSPHRLPYNKNNFICDQLEDLVEFRYNINRIFYMFNSILEYMSDQDVRSLFVNKSPSIYAITDGIIKDHVKASDDKPVAFYEYYYQYQLLGRELYNKLVASLKDEIVMRWCKAV